MQIDPTNNYSMEHSNKVLRSAMVADKTENPTKHKTVVAIKEEEKDLKRETYCESPEKKTEIVLEIDPHVSQKCLKVPQTYSFL